MDSVLTARPLRMAQQVLANLGFLMPAIPVAYLHLCQDPTLCITSHTVHEAAIAIAILEGAFISCVSWLCYMRSGEIFVKWTTVGFIGFTVIYSLHGAFTPIAGSNIWLFLLYGPTSRLVMSASLLLALVKFGDPGDPSGVREKATYWMSWFGAFLAINIAVALLAYSPIAADRWLRLGQEFAAVAMYLAGLIMMSVRNFRSPLMLFFRHSLVWFSMSSVAFMLTAPWTHLWWLAHGIFAGGFSILGYGILKSYVTTQSFDQVFRESELVESLADANVRLTETSDRLLAANRQLGEQVRALELARSQFATLFDVSPDGIILVKQTGRILKANSCAEQMFGCTKDGLNGLQVEELLPKVMRAGHERQRRLFEYAPVTRPMGGADLPLACLRLDGSVFYATISINGLVFEEQQCVVTFIRDVTRLLDATERQRTSEIAELTRTQLTETVFSLAPVAMFQLCRKPSGEYEIPLMGPKIADVLRTDIANRQRTDIGLWFNRVHPADLPVLIAVIESAAASLSPWKADWRASIPGQGLLPYCVQAEKPVASPDGTLNWIAYIRCTRERKEDHDQPPAPL